MERKIAYCPHPSIGDVRHCDVRTSITKVTDVL